MLNEKNYDNCHIVIGILLTLIVVVMLYSYWGWGRSRDNEHMTDTAVASYNPKTFQPAIVKSAERDNYIDLPDKVDVPWAGNAAGYGEVDNPLEPVDMGLSYNLCSKSCCSNTTYPPPFAVRPDDFVLKSDQDFVSSSYTCNNGWEDTGCVCMTPKQALFLNNRGNNA